MPKIKLCNKNDPYPRCEKKAKSGDICICLKTETFDCDFEIDFDIPEMSVEQEPVKTMMPTMVKIMHGQKYDRSYCCDAKCKYPCHNKKPVGFALPSPEYHCPAEIL